MQQQEVGVVSPPGYPLDPAVVEQIRQQAYDYAFGHGLVSVRKGEDNSSYVMHVPITILPTPWPKLLFEQAQQVQFDFNMLVHHLSRNKEFILNTLEGVPDDFTQKLLSIYKQIESEGVKQSISLGLFRSDYMLHTSNDGKVHLQQVELNTISSSFGALSTFTSQLHRYIASRFQLTDNYPLPSIPISNSQTALASAIAAAHQQFGDRTATTVMVTQQGERNLWDQRWIEFHLWEKHGVQLKRLTLAEILHFGALDQDYNLRIEGQVVSVVYFRAGYTPTDYPTPKEWDSRLLIERSRAIKCPSIAHHLVGAKKVQQVVAGEGVLEKLIEDQDSVARMRASFTGLYSTVGADSQETIQKAIKNYHDYVLKPQREGGGNNIYNEDLRDALLKMDESERAAYILMDRIRPTPVQTYIMREGKILTVSAVSELGIFGLFIADNDRIILNDIGGHLLRTKASSQEDGGVAAGVAVLDTPLLS